MNRYSNISGKCFSTLMLVAELCLPDKYIHISVRVEACLVEVSASLEATLRNYLEGVGSPAWGVVLSGHIRRHCIVCFGLLL